MIGKRIQMLRKKNNYSLTELSIRAGVAKSYLSSIERGVQKNPSIQFLEKLALVLGVQVEEFLQQTNDNTIDKEWTSLIQEAMHSGISKSQFKGFLDNNK